MNSNEVGRITSEGVGSRTIYVENFIFLPLVVVGI